MGNLAYMLDKLNITDLTLFVQNPKQQLKPLRSSKHATLVAHIAQDPSTAKVSGRCTVLAVQVAEQLNRAHPQTFEFKIYDLGRHRIARYGRTSLLVDPGSATGLYSVPSGEAWRYGEFQWSWSDNGAMVRTSVPKNAGDKIKVSALLLRV